jgi:VWFA-related protein
MIAGAQKVIAAMLFVLPAACCFAQPEPEPEREVTSESAPAKFTLSTTVIQVPVVVRDKDGHAVANLSAEDMQLFDDGKRQLISRFAVVQATGGATLVAGADSSAPRRFVVYLIDDVNLIPGDFANGRNAVLRQLDSLAPGDRAAVYPISDRTAPSFTADKDVLRKALLGINPLGREMVWQNPATRCATKPNIPGWLTFYRSELIAEGDSAAIADCTPLTAQESPGTPAGPPLSAAFAHCADEGPLGCRVMIEQDARAVVNQGERDVQNFFAALDRLIDQMAVMPGERLIVMLSPGIYVPRRFSEMEDEVLTRAANARVVINGIDTRGAYARNAGLDTAGDPTLVNNRYGAGETAERLRLMTVLTSGTGGVYLRGNNDLELQLRRAATVPEAMYILSFTPAGLSFDGKAHRLTVTLRNPRGFTVQARSSYQAPSTGGDPEAEIAQQVRDAFFSAGESQAIPVSLQTQSYRDDDRVVLSVAAKIDVSHLAFEKKDGRNLKDLSVVVGLFDDDGNFVQAFEKTIRLRFRDDHLAGWLKTGVASSTDFRVIPGRYTVRLVVRDSQGSQMTAKSASADLSH